MRDDEVRRFEVTAARWNSERASHAHQLQLNDRFANATPLAICTMWASGTNDAGRRLSRFEVDALVEAWVRIFGELPPTRKAS